MQIRISRYLSAVAVACATLVPAFGMNNSDIIKMVKADVSEETILVSISSAPGDYDTSVDALIEMKKEGVSEAIIQKMIAVAHGKSGGAKSGGAGAAASSAAPAARAYDDSEMPSIAPPLATVTAGREYFLRSSIHAEKDEYNATNYSRGELIPINTPVRIDAIKGDKIICVRRDTGTRFTVENVSKFTRRNTTDLAQILFSEVETPLDQLPQDIAASIRNGEPRLGMTKEQVLMARGYPPAHETSSTELDRWVYWSSRFVKQTLVFANGRLVEGRGIN